MATLREIKTKLENLRNSLASNLTAKGVTASSTESLNSLIPKVLDITTAAPVSDLALLSSSTKYLRCTGSTLYFNVPSGTKMVVWKIGDGGIDYWGDGTYFICGGGYWFVQQYSRPVSFPTVEVYSYVHDLAISGRVDGYPYSFAIDNYVSSDMGYETNVTMYFYG